MKVIKRDGSTVDFDRTKIANAIRKANAAVDEDNRISEAEIENIVHGIEEKNRKRLLVEDIQDMVECGLMKAKKYALAKAYIIYRYDHALARKANLPANIVESESFEADTGAFKINIKKLDEKATIPTYGSRYAAGADLYACLAEPTTIGAGETLLVHTGIAIELEEGLVGLIYARSGLASKRGLAPANKVGVVDCDYRGEIMVALHNHGSEAQTIEHGERIAQLVISPYVAVKFNQVDKLSDTVRGEGGFGSTGRK